MSEPELKSELSKLKASLFDLRRQISLRQLKDSKSISVTRHNVARIETVLSAKQKEG